MQKKITCVTIALMLTGLILEAFWFKPHHAVYAWQEIPGFYALLGLVSAGALMGFAKWLGKQWLYRKEDYYEE